MKHLSKIFTVLALFNFSAMMGGLFSTDVYLINKTNTPLIRGPIETAVGMFTRAAAQSKKEDRIKIQPGETKKLFSIPRLLPLQAHFREKSTNIKREGDRDIEGIVIHIVVKQIITKRRGAGGFSRKIRLTSYWNLGPHFTLNKRFVFKFGKLFRELHITALPI